MLAIAHALAVAGAAIMLLVADRIGRALLYFLYCATGPLRAIGLAIAVAVFVSTRFGRGR